MQTVTTVGLDIAKSVFQVHGVDREGHVIIRRQLRRRYVLAFFESLCTVPGRDRGLRCGAGRSTSVKTVHSIAWTVRRKSRERGHRSPQGFDNR